MPRRAWAGGLVFERAASGRDQSRGAPPSRDLSRLRRRDRGPARAARWTACGVCQLRGPAAAPGIRDGTAREAATLAAGDGDSSASDPDLETRGAAIVVG